MRPRVYSNLRSCFLPTHTMLPAVQVQAVKEKIESTQGDSFPAAHQVVIYQGKVWSGPSLCSAIKKAISAYWLIKVPQCCAGAEGRHYSRRK